MLYRFFTGGISLSLAFDTFLTIVGIVLPFSEYSQAFTFFRNFVNNIRTAVSNPSIGEIVAIIPNFAWTLANMIPGLTFVRIINNIGEIAQLV